MKVSFSGKLKNKVIVNNVLTFTHVQFNYLHFANSVLIAFNEASVRSCCKLVELNWKSFWVELLEQFMVQLIEIYGVYFLIKCSIGK